MTDCRTYLEQNSQRFLAELIDFLRIPSVSALSQHRLDVRRAGQWVAERLAAADLENVCVLETEGHPAVYADWLHAPGRPTVLIYGHFDVQPADPLEQWQHPPFEPTVRDGRVYARGASDDKGNMLAPILASEAMLRTSGALPVNVKLLFEGQEEIGSPQLADLLSAERDRLACDLVLSADGGQWSEEQPAILLSLRGGCGLQIDVTGPKQDLHSGLHGGAVQNPIHALAGLIDSMRADSGEILVDGFYDDVVALSHEERARVAELPWSDPAYAASLDVDSCFGEPGYSTLERQWTRPTLELNGFWSGFQGEGTKTVIPSTAHAKITCRLVANQQPSAIVELIAAHVERHTPPGVRATVTPAAFHAWPYAMPSDHPGNRAAQAVLEEIYGRAPYFIRSGASIPVCALFLENLGAYTVGFAFGLNDEGFHAPNEFFRLESFARAQRAYCEILRRLASLS